MSVSAIERLNAALSGRYLIGRELGEGGMAIVYLADDLKHERKVALKVLKPELAAIVGAERFLAEIKTTANLQHPHILPLHDSGEADGFLFYVMPYVDGESLRDRLEREKQLPVDEAVRIASDVAEALQSAHGQGVIHRDVKPANILLSQGRPLIADFGIALAVSAAGGGRLTETGLSMGTPYYMSPEQASADREPSAASDVYSLGCVLYEMLVGEPPHVGSSAQAVLAKILTADVPAPTAARPSIPAHVDAAIRRALERLPADRFAEARDFARALADPGFTHGETAAHTTSAAATVWKTRAMVAMPLAALFAVLAIAGWLRPASTESPTTPMRSTLVFPNDSGPAEGFALSPDGTQLAFASHPRLDGGRIWIRSLESGGQSPLSGTEEAFAPAWSLDGTRIAYNVGEETIRVVPAEGGPAVDAVTVPGGLGLPAWHPDGSVVFVAEGGVWRAADDGGTPSLLLAVSEVIVGEMRNSMPVILPDGRGILISMGAGGTRGGSIYAGDLTTGEYSLLLEGAGNAHYVDGWLVFRRSRAVLAQRFDAESRVLSGPAIPLIDEVNSPGGRALMAASARTVLFGVEDQSDPGLRWVDGAGGSESAFPGELSVPGWLRELSPDGSLVASGGFGLWVAAPGGLARRLEAAGDYAFGPKWSPDGRTLLVNSGEDGLFSIDVGGGSVELVVPRRPEATNVGAVGWGPGGEILYTETLRDGSETIWAREQGEAGRTSMVQAGALTGMLSPDGRWLAYVATQGSDEVQVFVRAYPGTQEIRVSIEGGRQPRWGHDGQTLYFVTPRGQAMRAALSFAGGLRSSAPVMIPLDVPVQKVMALPDGRLLVDAQVQSAERLLVIRDWQALERGGG